MNSVKARFRPSTVVGRPGTVYYLLCVNRTERQISTAYKLLPHEWDAKKDTVAARYKGPRAQICRSIEKKIALDLVRIKTIIAQFEARSEGFTADEVALEFETQVEAQSFRNFMNATIGRLKRLGKWGTSRNYSTALNSFMRFREEEDVRIEEFSTDLIEDYHAHLVGKGIEQNSISFYMRVLRAVYNRAIAEGLAVDARPFARVFTGVEKTLKRAISIADIQRIKNLELSKWPRLEFARDVFIFLFVCRGISFIDAAFLRKCDLAEGCITYRRKKTGQLMRVGLNPSIEQIIRRHGEQDSPMLLPIISAPGDNDRRQYESALRTTNNCLKRIAKMAGLTSSLTTYVSRHAWATIAKQKGVPVATISEALGHDSLHTTEIYLSELDAKDIDEANRLVIADLV